MSQLVDDVHQPHKVLCSEGNSVADAEALPAGHFRIGRCNVSSLIPGHGGIGSVVKKPEQQAPFTTNSAVDKDTAVDKSRSLVAGQESMKAGKRSAGVCHYNPWFQHASQRKHEKRESSGSPQEGREGGRGSEVSKSLDPGLPMDTAPKADFSAAIAAMGVPSPVALGDGSRSEERGAGAKAHRLEEEPKKALDGE